MRLKCPLRIWGNPEQAVLPSSCCLNVHTDLSDAVTSCPLFSALPFPLSLPHLPKWTTIGGKLCLHALSTHLSTLKAAHCSDPGLQASGPLFSPEGSPGEVRKNYGSKKQPSTNNRLADGGQISILLAPLLKNTPACSRE